jgi:hypothetical protein
MKTYVAGVVTAVVLGVLIVPGAGDFLKVSSGALVGLPTCESSRAVDDIKSVMKENAFRKLIEIKILFVEDQKTISKSAKETRCSATLTTNAGEFKVLYSFLDKGKDGYLVKVEPVLE